MKTKYTYKQIWTIAYPILISLIMEQLIGMTDTAFLGRVGEIELGASAIAGVYYLAIFMMAFGFSVGAQILIARRNGEGNYKEIGPIFYQGIYFLVVVAAILFTLSIVFSPFILKNIISSPHIYDAAESYIHWRVYGFFFSFVGVMFRAFFVGTTQTKTLTLNSIVMVLSNVVFNYILIFGKFGFPPELLGDCVWDTKTNLQKRKDAEQGACEDKKRIATRAKALNLDAIHDTVHEMCKDEARHGKGFEGLYNRYFGDKK